MSFQIFLHGKILGTEEFLRSAANDIEGRAYWVSLLSEVAPRALLGELGLSAMLLGSSGGGEFLLVLPTEFRAQAEEFCTRVAADAARQKWRDDSPGVGDHRKSRRLERCTTPIER